MHDEKIKLLEIDLQNRLKHLNRKFEIDGAISKVLLGKLLAKLNQGTVSSLQDAEFRVFSQFGDDGIIQHLVHSLDIKDKRFIEFGVENYNESNTRFLLESNNWQGLVMDGSDKNIEYIHATSNHWRHHLTAISSFITAENINQTIKDTGFDSNVGLLHIDIDGNDYWVWKAMTVIQPDIVIVEYNSLFGSERAITIPYAADFTRFKAHYSGVYFGCSLAALCDLATEKGYVFVGCNSAGNNAYFVRRDKLKGLKELSCRQGYVLASFREHRDEQGNLTFMSALDASHSLKGLEVFNTRTSAIEPF